LRLRSLYQKKRVCLLDRGPIAIAMRGTAGAGGFAID
jgi:hypothetical protein